MYMTGQEIAELCHVHPRTIRRWREDGRIPGTKQGRAYLYKREDVAKLLELESAAELPSKSDKPE